MARKRRFIFGADFNEEGLTRDGKPKKTAEDTQELDMSAQAMTDEQKEELIKQIEKAEKKAAAKKAAENPPDEETVSGYDDDNAIFSEEHAKIVSVILFAFGILLAMAVIFKGTDGWQNFHNFILGLFGLVSAAVPFIVMYTSYIISSGKKNSGRIIGAMFFWTIVACSAAQVFFSGALPENGLGEFISLVQKDGAEFVGGGIIGSMLSYFLLSYFGRVGAIMVMILIIFVTLLISTGKGVTDLFKDIRGFFLSVKNWLDGVDTFFNGEYDDYYDEDEEEAAEGEKRDISIVMDDIHEPQRETPKSEREPADPKEKKELDEFSRIFDIHFPDEKAAEIIEKKEEAPVLKPLRRVETMDEQDRELSQIINNALEDKERSDRRYIEEAAEETPAENTDEESNYTLPSLDLLSLPTTRKASAEAVSEMNEKAEKIVDTFKSFGVEVTIKDIFRGPSITRYEIKPGPGVKVSKIRGLEDDIALSLAAQGVRLEAPVPGKSVIGIEVPNINKDTVTLREILSSSEFREAESRLAFAVGKDITGNAIVGDITKMPHVIIAGTTGSGKSVCTRSIIMSILYKATPDEVKIILIDPKVVEFKVFEGIPHLLIPIVTEAKKAAGALNWAVNEMMRRYNTFAEIGANDLKSYNEIADEDGDIPRMPQIVVFIDELADMMLVAGKEVEDSICRLAQMGRAAGMHLVVATQRPTTDVITGLIKANIPSRIALSVMSQVDSRTIIDMAGADKLLGNGDMLYMPIGTSKPIRIQGCFASPKDISTTLNFIRSQATGEYDSQIVEAVENYVPQTKNDHGGSSDSGFEAGSDEDLIVKAAEVAVTNNQISTTLIQRRLKLGYARASRIMDELEQRGIVSPAEGSKPRKVLMSKMQFDEWKMRKLEE